MPNHTQLLRTLNLIRLFVDRPGKTVPQLAGLGRFVLGMADQVRVIELEPFKAFLREKISTFNI